MTLNTRLEQISIDLNRLRELDPNYKALSNASYHRYKMKPTWSEQQIKAFERKNQIILPDDFRDFLLQVGGGGAGPGYELALWNSRGQLKKTFPHTSTWESSRPVDIPEGRHLNLNLDDCEDEDWDSQYYWLWDGAIPITCEGCDLYHLLVVSGPERGNMWFTAEETPYIAPISGVVQEPESVLHSLYEYGGGGRLSFLDWYEHWLKIGLQRAVK